MSSFIAQKLDSQQGSWVVANIASPSTSARGSRPSIVSSGGINFSFELRKRFQNTLKAWWATEDHECHASIIFLQTRDAAWRRYESETFGHCAGILSPRRWVEFLLVSYDL